MSDFSKHNQNQNQNSKKFLRTQASDKEFSGLETSIHDQFEAHPRIIVDALNKSSQAEDLSSALLLHAATYYKNKIDMITGSGDKALSKITGTKSSELNSSVNTPSVHQLLDIRFTEAKRISEPIDWISKQEQRSNQKYPPHYFRWKMTGGPLILSVRAVTNMIEFFVVPEKEVPHITMSEFGSRFRGRFLLSSTNNGLVWTHNKEKLTVESSCTFVERLVDEVLEAGILRLRENPTRNPYFAGPTNASASVLDLLDFKGPSEKRLEEEKNNLLFKLLNQQEELKNQLARDLHDSVIADLMMLKRYLSGDRKLSTEETIDIVDEIMLQLRDIVNEYSPRQLQEWGLKVGIEDLLDRITRRTGIETIMDFEGELPRYPDLVTLHVFRVIQESLNNVEKHAGASKIEVTIRASKHGRSIFIIKDNGTGFDTKAVRLEADGSHSMGLEGMRERVELMRCFYPCSINISSNNKSDNNTGTTITLTLESQEKMK